MDPGYAPFNRRQFSALSRLADVDVIGVVPRRIGGPMVRGLPVEERIESLRVVHARYVSVPGMPSLNALSMAAGVLPRLVRQARDRRYDVLLASYGYPDGCAGVLLGRLLGLPVVVKCHGSDLNRVTRHRLVRFQIQRLLPRAGAVVVVSHDLARRARHLGVPEGRLHVVYNGIDHVRFRPIDKTEARRRLSLPPDRDLVLYVGHLEDYKGARDLLRAVPSLRRARPTVAIAFVGDGPLRDEVRAAAAEAGSAGVIRAIDSVPHDEVPWWMAAADVVCLPSWHEGMPNVLREAHACGRPVVATTVGGIPEAMGASDLGILVAPKDPEALAAALARQLDRPAVAPETIRRLAVIPTWEESAKGLYDVLARVTGVAYPRDSA